MFKKIFGVLVSAAIWRHHWLSNLRRRRQEEDTDAAARARVKVEKLGAGSNAAVEVKLMDGTKLKGYVSAREQDSFTVTDRKTGASSVVRYAEVSEVKKSGGGLSTKSWIIIGSAIAGAVVTWIVLKPAVCDGGAQSKFPC